MTARFNSRLIKRVLLLILLAVPQVAVSQTPATFSIQPETYVDFSKYTLPDIELPKPVAPSTFCNCYQYVKAKYSPALPGTKHILNNLKTTGQVAVFYYPSSGLYHYAYVIANDGVTLIIDEANYSKCKQGIRTISANDPSLLGFFEG